MKILTKKYHGLDELSPYWQKFFEKQDQELAELKKDHMILQGVADSFLDSLNRAMLILKAHNLLTEYYTRKAGEKNEKRD